MHLSTTLFILLSLICTIYSRSCNQLGCNPEVNHIDIYVCICVTAALGVLVDLRVDRFVVENVYARWKATDWQRYYIALANKWHSFNTFEYG
jgi:hypothetical protein